jgi:eukaryotic-like serine/threonine-protein kinase
MRAVLFTRAGTLMALPFDMKRLEPAGEPFAVAGGIATSSRCLVATSTQGVLAYVSRQERAELNSRNSPWQYLWRDRKGGHLGAFGEAGTVAMISPNGRQLALDWNGQISVLDLATGVATRLTFRRFSSANPIRLSDGRYVAYNSAGGIFQIPADGAGAEQLLGEERYSCRSEELVAGWTVHIV